MKRISSLLIGCLLTPSAPPSLGLSDVSRDHALIVPSFYFSTFRLFLLFFYVF